MKEIIERLRELEAALSPAPWIGCNHPSYVNEMRNSLVPILDRLEKLEAVAEAARALRNLDRNDGWKYSYGEQRGEKLDDALAALKGENK
jgi:hypothetical protein